VDHLQKNTKALTDIAERLLKDEVLEGKDFEAMAKAEVVTA
jgi:ATP-dependent Zn protease